MKKRNFALIVSTIVFAAAAVFAGCSSKNTDESTANNGESLVPAASDSAENVTQPDPETPTEKQEETSASEEEVTTAPDEETTEEATEEETNEDNQESITKSEDELLVDEAQRLFDKACETDWNFHVGSPYTLDYNSFVENKFGWQYYLVTDSGVNSIADVEADYFKVFSSTYGSDLSELYLEKDGRVYALDGARGADIFYVDSAITGIKSRSDSEIVFTVENYYNGDDFTGAGDITKTDEFSVVIESDGSWRAGKFNLPY